MLLLYLLLADAIGSLQPASYWVDGFGLHFSKQGVAIMFFQLAGRHRLWLTVTYAVASSPLVIGTFLWIKSLSWVGLFGLGIIVGTLPFALHHLTHLRRSQLRRGKALRVAQLCSLDVVSLTRMLAKKAAPTWFRQDLMYEKVTWLNAGLEEIWPSLNEAASGLLKGILQSVLDPYKFSVIQKIMIKSVTLGTVSPLLGGVKFTEGGEDEAILEVELDWRHGQDAKIVIQLQTTGPLLTVQIKDFVVFGVLKLIFKPLKEQFPGFGAVIISLREAPTVDFQTKILGGDILMIPGVGNAVDNIILTALTDILVWPNRLVIPIMQGDYSYLQLKSVGQLDIQLVEAQHIPKADIWGESDPYAVIYIRRKQGCIRTSKVIWNTSCPVWNENFTLDVEDPETQKLTIKVYDYDRLKFDDFIGAKELPLSQFEPNQQQDIWIDLTEDLQSPQLKSRGKVHLRILYKLFASEKTVAEPVEEQLGKEETFLGAEESSEGSKCADMLKNRDFTMDKPIVTGNTVPEEISRTDEVNYLTHLVGVNEGVVGTEAISNEKIKTGIEVS